MKKVAILLFAILFAGAVHNAHAQKFTSDDGYVEFVSTAPLLEFKGVSDQLHGLIDLDQNLLDYYVDLNTLETGIRRRDRDMRNSYLETDRFPFAEFTGELTEGLEQIRSGDLPANVEARGIFTMRNIEREIAVEGIISAGDGGGLLLEASWVVRLEDYNIERPSVLFYELSEEQTINIRIHLKQTN